MARNRKALTDDEIAALCVREYEDAESLTEIQNDRIKALDYYDQKKFGNEEQGLSQFVSSDVRDAVEWVLPQVVDIFAGGDTAVQFEAENAEDAKQAEEETRYCQYVFERENKGVIVAYQWFKDALLQKNGIVKVYWDEKTSRKREEYKDKTAAEFHALEADEEFEIDEVSIMVGGIEYDEDQFAELLKAFEAAPQSYQNIVNDTKINVVGHRKSTVAKVCIDNVPPENFVVQKDHNSIFLDEAAYCCERLEKTRSQLIEDGYDEELINSLPASQEIAQNTTERATRMEKEGGAVIAQNTSAGDASRDIIIIYDHYIRSDKNGDGMSELLHVRTAGSGARYILEVEEVDRIIYHALTPYLNSHKFYGRSIYDNLADLQRAKSQIWRNVFDNFMYSSLPRKIVKGNVNIEDLMTYVPGGVIRSGHDGEVTNDAVPFVAGEAFPMLDKIDNMRSERTGFNRETAGLDPSALANSTNLVGMSILSQSNLLVKMIATLFAHSGFAEMMLHVRELVMKYESKPKIFDLTGSVIGYSDPRTWAKQRSAKVKVGIGYAGKIEEIGTLQQMISMQEKAIAAQGGINGPLTSPEGIFNTIKRICQRMGIKDVTSYFTDPSTYKAPTPQPSLPEVQLKASIEKMNNDQKAAEAERALKMKQMDIDSDIKKSELEQRERIEMEKIASNEEIALTELLYKYGKDAHDRLENNIRGAEERLTRNKEEKEKEEPGEQKEAEDTMKEKPEEPKKESNDTDS